MKKKGHIILAFILSFLFIYLTIYLGFNLFEFTWKSITLVSLIIVFYSLLPDIDHKNSTITWWFFGIGFLGLAIGIFELIFNIQKINPILVLVFSTLFLVFTFLSANLFEHRGIIHTVWVGVLASCPLLLIFHSFFYFLLAYIAWHSHLLGDGFLFKIR
jgi:hypothetical protein